MKAVVITRPGGPDVLEIQNRPLPEPGRHEIRVRVHASALNRADLSQRLGRYPAPPGLPQDISGLEFAGVVDAVGDGVTLWKPADRVMGIVGGGAHAEYLRTHEREAIAIPDRLTMVDAAAIPEVFMTAYDGLIRQLGLRPGQTVLIHAAGSGVGTAAIQICRAAGIRTIGTSRSRAKLEKCLALGLGHAVDSSDDGWESNTRELTGAEGLDAVLDLVGGSMFPASLRLLRTRGQILVVGLTAGRGAELDLGLVLNRRLVIRGTALRSRPPEEKISLAQEFSARMMPLFSSGQLRPVIDRIAPFADIQSMHAELEANRSFGKIVLDWEVS